MSLLCDDPELAWGYVALTKHRECAGRLAQKIIGMDKRYPGFILTAADDPVSGCDPALLKVPSTWVYVLRGGAVSESLLDAHCSPGSSGAVSAWANKRSDTGRVIEAIEEAARRGSLMRELTTTHQGWVGHGGSMVISARQAALCTAVTERIIRSHPETAPVLLSHVGEPAAKALLCVESFDQELVDGMLRFGSIRGSTAFALHPSVPEDVVEGTHAWQRSAAAEALAGLAAGSSAAWGLLPKISTPAIEALLFSADPDRWLVRVESRILGGERIEVSSVLVGKILMRDPLLSGLVPFFGKDGRVGLGGFSAVWQMCDLVWGDSTEEGSLRAEVQEVSMRREVVARAESVLRAEGGREPFISLAGANAALADLECLIEMVLLLGRADEATSETAKVEVSL